MQLVLKIIGMTMEVRVKIASILVSYLMMRLRHTLTDMKL